jgi:hypothetical protein
VSDKKMMIKKYPKKNIYTHKDYNNNKKHKHKKYSMGKLVVFFDFHQQQTVG